jgi:multicomponent Na+:H+ antiporter subunit D
MSAALVVIALSMIGIPPTGGFFGKWYIILGAMEARNYLAIVAVLIATLLTLAYFLKLFERMFRERSAQQLPLIREVPLEVRISLGATAVAIILLGLMSDHIVSFLLKTAVPPGL